MRYALGDWDVVVDGGFRQYERVVLPEGPSQILLRVDHKGELCSVLIEPGSGANVSCVFIGNVIQCAYNTKPRTVQNGDNVTILIENVTNSVKLMVVTVDHG